MGWYTYGPNDTLLVCNSRDPQNNYVFGLQSVPPFAVLREGKLKGVGPAFYSRERGSYWMVAEIVDIYRQIYFVEINPATFEANYTLLLLDMYSIYSVNTNGNNLFIGTDKQIVFQVSSICSLVVHVV